MAKGKGGDASKQMLVQHGEKIGLGVVAVLSLACIAFAFIGKKTLDDNVSPANLTAALEGKKAAEAAITVPVPAPPPTPAATNVPPAPFQLKPWVFPLFPLQGTRGEPMYFPAEQVIARGGRALFNVKGKASAAPDPAAAPAAGGKPEDLKVPENSEAKGAFYTVVTAVVDVAKQRAEYDRIFADTLKMPGDEKLAQDAPEYFRAVIERAEVAPGVADDKLAWEPINEADNAKVTEDDRDPSQTAHLAEWAEELIDVVPPAFTIPAMTYGKPLKEEELPWLPPRLPKKAEQWALAEVGHPEITRGMEALKSGGAAAPAKEGEAPAAAAPMNQQPVHQQPAVDVNDPEAALKKFMAGYKYRMIRYWDFTVKPATTYKYRVTLVLRNPNRGYTRQYLKDEKLAVGNFRPASPLDPADATRPVSAPSAAVTTPGTSDIAVGGIVLAGGAARLPEDGAHVVATVWENTAEAIDTFGKSIDGIRIRAKKDAAKMELATLQDVWANVDFVDASKEFQVFRGSWINIEDNATLPHPLSMDEATNQPKVETLKTVRFNTNFLLVDLRGGKPLVKPTGPAPRRPVVSTFTEPAEYLLLDPSGNLVVRTETRDAAAYAAKLAAEKQATADAADAKGGKKGGTIEDLNK
jgi:hypothetical protein